MDRNVVEVKQVNRALRLRCFHGLYRYYREQSKPWRISMFVIRNAYEILHCRQEGNLTFRLKFETLEEASLAIRLLSKTPSNLIACLTKKDLDRLAAIPHQDLLKFG